MSDVDIEAWADALMDRHPTVALDGHELYEITEQHPDDARVRPSRSRRHPVDRLRRYHPTPDVRAIGLVSGGWIAPMDDGLMPSAHPDGRRVVQVVVMDRAGVQTARVRQPDGAVLDMGGGGVGRVPDALRAALARRPAA